ncbi:DcaP family trimeric outer membrane transporter [Acinetobacter sp. 1000160]|uniref:DcaP family trimeric outer membrane transporter n=1 Tax=Acinetobacter sp. 1000160 TaxID=1310800 RepID=UPI000445E855|nr:DcaP family trimeric outer membrane transporter [Acinetobacter sp. 1000160]EXB48802.1 gram-negative porin family protein [Acinetobacter baumannii 146457]EYT22737.1 gram-negative porin family protein [Acinetobacter sp. 1000160]
MDKFILTVQKSLLALSVVTVISPVYAATDQAEIAQLRQEVQELRAMLQQYVQQKAPVQPANPVVVTASPQATETSAPKLNLSKGGAEVNLYGYIRADASYQAKGASTMYNNISGVPLEHTAEETQQKDRLHSTVNVTRLGLNFKTPSVAGEVGGKLEMDFFGGATRDQFRIRHAYITLDQWLIGQTWSTFIAPEYYPETVDAGTFVGGALQRSPMLRYSDKLSANTSFAVAIEDPKYTATSDPDNEMRMPALVGRLNHKFDNGSLLSGRTFMAEKKTSTDKQWAWGVGLGGKYQLSPQTFLKADYYHVKGDGRFLLWANNSYVIDDQNNIQSNEFDTISAGITHQFNSQLRSTLGYGYMKAKDDNRFAEIQKNNLTQNKELWQGWINAMYNPYKPITLGVEYVYGERETFDGRNGIDNRVNMMATYDF